MDCSVFSGPVYSYRLNSWRLKLIRRFVNVHENLNFKHQIYEALEKHKRITLLVWSVRKEYDLPTVENLEIVSVEDGFLRSVGLGAEFCVPISLVFDKRGIYFDATTESDLEFILNNIPQTEEIFVTGRKIQELIKTYRINKYNLYEKHFKINTHKKIILVPGQVERDKSIIYGSPVIRDNLSLLREVRLRNPDAYIIFKVHPDVYRCCRKNFTCVRDYYEYADIVVEDVSTISLIENADEVHTMTSLVGFEALLFNKKVVCYGAPFYSGWGLTEDRFLLPRRKRKLTVEQLVFASYFLYPTYVSLIKETRIDAIEAIHEIAELKQNPTLLREINDRYISLKQRMELVIKKAILGLLRR